MSSNMVCSFLRSSRWTDVLALEVDLLEAAQGVKATLPEMPDF